MSSLELSCQTVLQGPQCSENGIKRENETLEASGSQQSKIDGTSIKEETIDGGDSALGGNSGSCEMTESTGTVRSHCKKIDGTSIKEERIDEGDSALDENSGSCESCGSWQNKEERGDRALGGNSGSHGCEMTESALTVCSHCKKIDGTSIKEEKIDGGDTARGGNSGSCGCEMTESALTVCSHCKKIVGTSIKEERIDGGDSILDANSGSCECEMTESTGTVCSHCKKMHEITNTNAKMLQCFFCDCSFSEEKQLTKHLQNHVGILNSDTFQCSSCKESFLSNSDLVRRDVNIREGCANAFARPHYFSCTGLHATKLMRLNLHINRAPLRSSRSDITSPCSRVLALLLFPGAKLFFPPSSGPTYEYS
ncbi:uncharacterized protein LOC129281657 isoform X2 [Lytechinus pictus]|uniref:uncharacterized protein LOC129281657 isoform X2 n=1 Tax=Lytechinus pictus TaxID=7653 RepID=UPI0030BA2530